MFWGMKPQVNWLCIYGAKCWASIPAATQQKGQYKSIKGLFVGYYDHSKSYKVWISRMHSLMKVRDVII